MSTDYATVRAALQTVLVTTVTPFDADASIRFDQLERHCGYLVENGVTALIPCGNTGEFTSLGTEEAKRVVAATVAAAGPRVTVIAGVGGPTSIAIELARAAEEAGANAIMVHHPSHTYIDRKGLGRYYEQIIDSVGLGVVIYKRGLVVEDALIRTLVEHERVVGVKYAVNDVHSFASLVASSSSEVTWICGTAERWAPFFFLAGATSFSSGLGNFAPRKALELLELLRADRWEDAMRVRGELAGFEDLRQADDNAYNVPAVKAAMSLFGLCGVGVREPLLELSGDACAFVGDCVSAWGTKPSVEPVVT